MTDQDNKTYDIIKSKYAEITKVLALLEQELPLEFSSTDNIEIEIGSSCIRGTN